jgi:microcystin-dependent protein
MSNARNLANAGASAAGGLAPTGTVLPFAGSAAPTGWLLCFGQAVSRTTYASLFATLGTTYGSGDGSTTFGVPDLRGRIPGGKDNMGGSAASRLTSGGSGVDGATLGAAGGAQTHTLDSNQIPSHTHGAPPGSNGFWGDAGGLYAVNAGGSTVNTNRYSATASTGGGTAHNNTQPTIVLNYIIKT